MNGWVYTDRYNRILAGSRDFDPRLFKDVCWENPGEHIKAFRVWKADTGMIQSVRHGRDRDGFYTIDGSGVPGVYFGG